jgi:hypothetical protein
LRPGFASAFHHQKRWRSSRLIGLKNIKVSRKAAKYAKFFDFLCALGVFA